MQETQTAMMPPSSVVRVAAWLRLLLAFTAVAVTGAISAEIAPLAPGSGSFVFTDSRGNADKPITVWYHRPAGASATSPIVFVMHGVKRNGKEYRDSWVALAEARKFFLVCPEFGEAAYPTRAYQQGNIVDGKGATIPQEKWTFSAIEHLFDALQPATGSTAPAYYLYGHSAGAQFVHRFVLFLPEARYARAVSANPGYYTMPDFAQAYPYGLKGTGATPETLQRSMAREFNLLLGTEDTNATDENLRQTLQAEAQGKTRLERGQNYMRKSTEAAAKLGVPLRWHSETVSGAGHSNSQMETAAAARLFAPSKKASGNGAN